MADVVEETDADAIARRLQVVQERIDAACRRVRRSPVDVTLIGVSKTFPIEAVYAARDAGLTHFGENRVQDLVEKARELPGRIRGGGVEWSMIGHLQRNKARDVVENADHFHALDSLRLAKELEKGSRRSGRIMPCLVQVNISGEASKYGLQPQETHAFLDRLASLEHIRVEGLMAMATHVDDPEAVRPEFRRMRELFDGYQHQTGSGIEMKKLSIGMSNDFEVAVEEGATHVRIGSAIFGAREA
jgi:hypothetical protein